MVVFVGNVGDDNGGGLSCRGSNSVDSSLALTNVVFIGNEAVNLCPYEGTDLIFADGFEDSEF